MQQRPGLSPGITLPGAGNITIASPADWATVNGPKAIIKGAVDTTTPVNNVMIQVSNQNSTGSMGYIAQVNGKYFAAAVNLDAGANTVKATVTYLNGQQKDTTITVTAVIQPQKIQLSATPTAGTMTVKPNGQTTLDVTFRVTTTLAYPVASYTWDFNGDGSVDLTCNSLSSVTASYQQIGLYLATVTVTDTQGNRYTDTVIVNVMDAVAMGDFFTGKWNDMKNALYSGDISRALSHYAEESKDAYNQQFTALSPYLQQIVTDMGSFHLVRVIDGNAAECELRSVKNGITYSFQVLYVRDDNGNWGIHSF
jgi:hypothetical protein